MNRSGQPAGSGAAAASIAAQMRCSDGASRAWPSCSSARICCSISSRADWQLAVNASLAYHDDINHGFWIEATGTTIANDGATSPETAVWDATCIDALIRINARLCIKGFQDWQGALLAVISATASLFAHRLFAGVAVSSRRNC